MNDMYIKIRKPVFRFLAWTIGALIQQDATGSGAHKISCSIGAGGGGFTLGLIRPQCEADELLPPSVNFKAAWAYCYT